MAFELGNFYMCMDTCVASFNMWYCDTKNYCYYFPDQILILKHVIFVLFITCCIKCFQFCVFNSFLLYELMFFFVILDVLNLTVFVRYYWIQKSKL